MDEAFVDVTKEAKLRVTHGACPASWHGHLHLGEVGTAAGSTLASVRCSASLEGGHGGRALIYTAKGPWWCCMHTTNESCQRAPAELTDPARTADRAGGRQPPQANGPAGNHASVAWHCG